MSNFLEQWIWSTSGTNNNPGDPAIAAGFDCGDADPYIFNWILNVVSACVYRNDGAVALWKPGNPGGTYVDGIPVVGSDFRIYYLNAGGDPLINPVTPGQTEWGGGLTLVQATETIVGLTRYADTINGEPSFTSGLDATAPDGITSAALRIIDLLAGMNKTFKVNPTTGTVFGGVDGGTFDTIANAINASPPGCSLLIELQDDLDITVQGFILDFIQVSSGRHVQIGSDIPGTTRTLTRQPNTDGRILANYGSSLRFNGDIEIEFSSADPGNAVPYQQTLFGGAGVMSFAFCEVRGLDVNVPFFGYGQGVGHIGGVGSSFIGQDAVLHQLATKLSGANYFFNPFAQSWTDIALPPVGLN